MQTTSVEDSQNSAAGPVEQRKLVFQTAPRKRHRLEFFISEKGISLSLLVTGHTRFRETITTPHSLRGLWA